MPSIRRQSTWDAIVIGSGMGGLSAASALARCGQRVLVLEQHSVAGGMTQTFSRGHWRFGTGVHYIAGVGSQAGAEGQMGRLLDWLSAGKLQFSPCGDPYDLVRLPGFEFGIGHPESAYRAALEARFPAQSGAIAHWFEQMHAARSAAVGLMVARGLPPWAAWGLRLWQGEQIARFRERSLADALDDVPDPLLRAVLGARWGDYGAAPGTAPLLEHALVTGAYNAGAYYPVGGPDRIAQALGQVIAGAGGEVRLGACVEQITLAAGRASGVTLRSGAVEDAGAGAGVGVSVEHAHWVISAMGAANTAAALPADAAPAWQQAVGALRPGLSYIALYLGFEGDIRAAGASAANHWIYASPDVGQVWLDPVNADAPGLFVSFGSLKDPACTGGPTGEVLALCDSRAFAPWLHPASGVTPPDYAATKALIAARLLAQFMRHFPALAPLLRFHELATPVTQQRYAHSPDGAMYGLEMSAARLASPALDVRTPVPGLLLAGQDVGGAGVPAAAISGLMAAAVVAPTLWRRLG